MSLTYDRMTINGPAGQRSKSRLKEKGKPIE